MEGRRLKPEGPDKLKGLGRDLIGPKGQRAKFNKKARAGALLARRARGPNSTKRSGPWPYWPEGPEGEIQQKGQGRVLQPKNSL